MNRDEGPLRRLSARYPELEPCLPYCPGRRTDCRELSQPGKLLICGNGGSAADSEHIVGELMKGFMSKRRLSEPERRAFIDAFPVDGVYLADRLQGALPAIALTGSSALGEQVGDYACLSVAMHVWRPE